MRLSICSPIVITGIASNGTSDHPGVVNQVHGDGSHGPAGCVGMVNVTVFPDCGTARHVTSMYVFEDKASAYAWSLEHGGGTCGYPPERA
jgi:hypothetical protein